MKYSVIVLLEETYKDSIQFIQDLHELFLNRQETFEILILMNGADRILTEELCTLSLHTDNIRAFEFNTKTSQAVRLKAGTQESTGEIIVVCDAYKQITDDSFIKLLEQLDDRTDVISPWRQRRVDSPFNQFQSRLFNALTRTLTATDFHDLSCTVKLFRREVLEDIEIYGNMYRFLPILAARRGFAVKEVKCDHYQQRGVSTFYSLSHYFTVLIDIFTLYFNVRFTRKPLRFFSAIGLLFLLIGICIASYVFTEKFFFEYPIGGRPELLLAILFMVLGIQAASVGLLGEIIAFTHGRKKKEYSIEKVIE